MSQFFEIIFKVNGKTQIGDSSCFTASGNSDEVLALRVPGIFIQIVDANTQVKTVDLSSKFVCRLLQQWQEIFTLTC